MAVPRETARRGGGRDHALGIADLVDIIAISLPPIRYSDVRSEGFLFYPDKVMNEWKYDRKTMRSSRTIFSITDGTQMIYYTDKRRERQPIYNAGYVGRSTLLQGSSTLVRVR